LKITHHIIVSIFFHAALLGILLMIRPVTDDYTFSPVFNVKIVEPERKEMPPPQVPVLPSKPEKAIAKIPREPQLPPETIFGKGPAALPRENKLPPETMSGKGTGSEKTGEKQGETGGATSFVKGENTGSGEGEKQSPDTGELLFDTEVIEKYASKGDTENRDVIFDVPEFHNRGYMRMLKTRIERIWKYPPVSAQQRISGDLFIKFTIKRDGSIGEIKLLRTSGHNELDEAAMQAIRDAEPYWPLPDDWKKEELSINGHFIYLLGRSYML
jgi:protein TonB